MQIKSIKNTGNYIAKEVKSLQKAWPERVASSAKLKGIKGSETQRNQLAEELNNKLFKIIDNVFEQKGKKRVKWKNPQIEKKELLDCIKKVIPEVKINIKYEKDPMYAAFIENILDRTQKTVVGFTVGLRGPVKKGQTTYYLRHEMRHIFDNVTQPKIAARNNTGILIGRLKNYDKNIDWKHFEFYANDLYQKVQNNDIKNEFNLITKKTNKYFKELNTTSEEKIEVLQRWRHGLKTELNAYTDEANYFNKKNPKKHRKEDAGAYFFEQKIKLLEQMLKDEINAVRKLSAEKYAN